VDFFQNNLLGPLEALFSPSGKILPKKNIDGDVPLYLSYLFNLKKDHEKMKTWDLCS
jgi:hypothetical protein